MYDSLQKALLKGVIILQNTIQQVGVAVSSVSHTFDQLFSYITKQPVSIGCRVIVPFGIGNKKRIGIVLEIQEFSPENKKLKEITSVLETKPVLNAEQLEMIFFLKETTFCTYFDALQTIMPSGMQFKIQYITAVADFAPKAELTEEESFLLIKLRNADSQKIFNKLLKQEPAKGLQVKGFLMQKAIAVPCIGNTIVDMVRLKDNFKEKLQIKNRITEKQKLIVKVLNEKGTLTKKEVCYLCGITESVIKSAEKNGLIELYKEENFYEEINKNLIVTKNPDKIQLSEEQQFAFESVKQQIIKNQPQCFLLHGITGSGKTSVFKKLIDFTVKLGKQVILLVPEISLTPQIVNQFYVLFGNIVAVMHSALSDRQRRDMYKKIQCGDAKIIIGTRSAVFAPAENIGLIILDEEGERTYKSDSSPRYHTVSIAKKRCRTHNCPLLLASATPSIESYYYAEKGIYQLLKLNHRYKNMPLPVVKTIDMNKERSNGNFTEFSSFLREALKSNLAAGEQSILLLNRRGYNTMISCCDCNNPVYCPNCSVPMTYHKVNKQLMCHYCGHMQSMVKVCPTCGSERVVQMGFGTQKIEEELERIVPDAKILRMDADTISSRNSYEEKFRLFQDGEYDIMLGTQMIGKGLDFPNVTLVGVLSVDKSLFSEDFRSYERTFSLITQVVGRSGRGDKLGRAVLQTFMPDHYVLELAAQQNYDEFYEQEISNRRLMIAPPVCDICIIGLTGEDEEKVKNASEYMMQSFNQAVISQNFDKPLQILKPIPCQYGKINGKYRYRLLIKCKDTKPYRDLIRLAFIIFSEKKEFSKVYYYADMNGNIGI